MTPTQKVKEFISANDHNPVVWSEVLSLEHGGGLYELEDGTTYKLYAHECRMLPDGYPKWKASE